jgi:hypothetical protein
MTKVFSMNCDATPLVDACGHAITVNGEVSQNTTTRAAGAGSAFFNGGYLSTPSAADLQFGTGSFTIVFYFNAAIQDALLIGNSGDLNCTSVPGWGIQLENTSGSGLGIRFDISDGVHKFTEGNTAHWDFTSFQNVWNNVSFVIDRAKQLLSIYANNSLAATKDISTIGSISNSNSLYIGQRMDGWGTFYGYLDEINIYNDAVYPACSKKSGLFFLHG